MLELGGGIAEGVFAHHVALFSGRAVAGDTVVFKGVSVARASLCGHFENLQTPLNLQIWNGSSAVCDIIIAIAMTYYVRFTSM